MRLLALAFLALPLTLAAQERVITVSGSATVYAKPDVARIYYGIKVSEPTTDAVKDVLTKTGTAIDESVKKLKMTNVKISTAPLSIRQVIPNQQGGLGGIVAPGGAAGAPPAPGTGPYSGAASHTALITDADPEKLRVAVDGFLKAIVEAGANTSGGEDKDENPAFGILGQSSGGGPKVVLSRNDDSASRDEALQAAVTRAIKNAKAIAKGLGAADVKILSVTEEAAVAVPANQIESIMSIYGNDSGSTPKSPAGEIEIKVRVVIRCTY